MAQSLQALLKQYDHELTNVKLGVFIRASQPQQTVIAPSYGVAIFLIVTGVLSAIIWSSIGLILLLIGIIRSAYFWYNYLELSGDKPGIYSLLISDKNIQLSKNFRVQHLEKDGIKDISIRMLSEYGESEAQFFFINSDGSQFESIILRSKEGASLEANANRIADYLWNLIKIGDTN